MKYVLWILVFVVGLFSYGFGKAKYDLYEGLSLMQAGYTFNSMNPVSAEGYRFGLNTNADWVIHVENIKNRYRN